MNIVYPVIFTQTNDEQDTYLIEIPDLNGVTQGLGLSDAFYMARNYIGNALLECRDADIPSATSPTDIDISSSQFSGSGKSFVSLVDVDMNMFRQMMGSKSVRRNVSLPEYLDKAAENAHLNVSKILQEALTEKLGFSGIVTGQYPKITT